ncbi:asr7252 (plasmid) [Nostoc sp. PCC 7120 = FACHB-418]|nr:asr7252 [Nostoc sp. PCC 7120 = FACHB-418]
MVTHVGEYSCTIKWWDGDYTAKVEHLKLLELLEEDCRFLQQLCERLRRLHEVAGRDEAVDWLLQGLGKQAKPYLSALQAKLLAAVEREYGIDPKFKK